MSRSKPIETILVFVQQERAAWALSPANQARRRRDTKIDASPADSCLGEHVTTGEKICNPNERRGVGLVVSKQFLRPVIGSPARAALATAREIRIGLFKAQADAADLGLFAIVDA